MWGACDPGVKMIYDLLRSTVQENEKLEWWRGKWRTQRHKIHLGVIGDRTGCIVCRAQWKGRSPCSKNKLKVPLKVLKCKDFSFFCVSPLLMCLLHCSIKFKDKMKHCRIATTEHYVQSAPEPGRFWQQGHGQLHRSHTHKAHPGCKCDDYETYRASTKFLFEEGLIERDWIRLYKIKTDMFGWDYVLFSWLGIGQGNFGFLCGRRENRVWMI